ncbi:MAG: hypothetical protein V3U20_11460 [Thermoplasmata archaeon]
MKSSKITGRFYCDEKGALEGLPLYLIILVVIAAMAIVILFSYLSVLKTVELAKIEVYIDGQKVDPLDTTEGEHDVYIVAIGDDGTKLKGVTISLIGAGVNTVEKTDANGKADFGTLDFTIVTGNWDEVDIEASYEGGNINIPKTYELLIKKP